MIDFFLEDQTVTIPEIDQFIDQVDQQEVFSTRLIHNENFGKYFEKLIKLGQVATFRDVDDGRLRGFLAWMIVDEDRKKEVNKINWKIPDNVSSGDIFFVGACALQYPQNMWILKEHFKRKIQRDFPQVKKVCCS